VKDKSLESICDARKIAADATEDEETVIDRFDRDLVHFLKKRDDLTLVDEDIEKLLSKYSWAYDEIDDALFLQDLITDPDALLETEQEMVERRYSLAKSEAKIAADRNKNTGVTQDFKKDVIRMHQDYKKMKKMD
jgi:hypothetical protein